MAECHRRIPCPVSLPVPVTPLHSLLPEPRPEQTVGSPLITDRNKRSSEVRKAQGQGQTGQTKQRGPGLRASRGLSCPERLSSVGGASSPEEDSSRAKSPCGRPARPRDRAATKGKEAMAAPKPWPRTHGGQATGVGAPASASLALTLAHTHQARPKTQSTRHRTSAGRERLSPLGGNRAEAPPLPVLATSQESSFPRGVQCRGRRTRRFPGQACGDNRDS